MTTTTTDEMPRPRQPSEVVEAIPTVVADRFSVERVLHRSLATSTLAAVDTTNGERVVVKTARSAALARGTRLRLLHEAEVLRTLGGTGLVPLVDAGDADGLFYLAMPLVPGRTLAERLREGRLTVDESLAVAIDLLTALEKVHSHGVLHRDIKPTNVMVDDGPVRHATLIDFGLARSAHLDESVRDEPVGTARYMSPEQAGLLHHEVDERSDLYSLGVVVYECLAGAPPFTGSTVGEVLRQHLVTPAPDVRAAAGAVPTTFGHIVQRLLRKDPRDRYQSAAGALADLQQLQRMLNDGNRDPVVVLGSADRRSTLTEPAFVGRRDELTALLAASREAADGRGGVVLVEAESGGGKSRLLDELAARAVDMDALVLRGQGVDQAARRPFQVLEGVAAGIAAAAPRDRALADRLQTRLADESPVLVASLPALADVFTTADTDQMLGPEEYGETRALAALCRLFDVLGSEQRPAVVLLDDCQWADEPSVRLLARWQRETGERGVHVLVVVGFRAEEVRAGDPLRKVSDRRLALAPFAAADVRGLVESMAGQVPDVVVDAVTRLSSGSPFMASAVLRGLVETGALFHDGHEWRTDPTLIEDVQSSREAATMLARRLDLLDASALALLVAGAVVGKEFDLDLAAGLVDSDTVSALGTVQSLRSRHLLWVDADALRATFVHDKLREALLYRLAPSQRRDLHARAARLLTDAGGSPYELAYHFHAAGDDRAAFPHAVAAAEQARARHALAAAQQQYEIAVQGADASDADTWRVVQTGLGEVLMLRGSYDEAAGCFRAALDVATDAVQRAEIAHRLGELAFKRGAVPESVGHLEAALRSLERWVPRSRAMFLLSALWETLVQAVHCLLPRRWTQRRRLDRAGNDILAARIYSRLAYSYWFSRGAVPCGWAHLREMNLLERYPPTLELAQAYSEHAPVATTLPWYSRGIAYVKRSLEIRRSFGDVWGQGQSLAFYGVVLYSASRFEEAIEKLAEAIRLLERTGDQWEMTTALWHVGFCNYRLGRVDAALEAFRRCFDTAREIGDYQAAAIGLSGIAKVTGGEVEGTDVAELLVRCRGDVGTTGELATGEAVRLIKVGQPERAAQLLERTRREVRAAGVRNEYVAPILPWLLTALRVQAEMTDPYDAHDRQQLLRRARVVGWRARSVAFAFRNNLPHVLREQALLALLRGQRDLAMRLVNRALRAAMVRGMAMEVAELRVIEDRLHVPSSRPGAAVSLARADNGASVTLSLVDRFDTLLRIGRTIATALTPDAIYDAVRVAAVELLRAEECTVVLVHDDVEDGLQLRALDASSGFGLSEQLVTDCLTTRAVAVYADDVADPSQSILLHRARSALAAPIFVRGRAVASWHVVHRQVSGLFGAEEQRLAEFVSALAGAALENAEGFAEVQALSQSLERRVEERTEELSVANTALRSTLAELERVNQELRRLDELKSDFVAMVSHELRSPLTSIIGYCSTMMRHWDKVDDERKKSFVEIVERQSRRLSGLVNDLLEMSRIESGHLETQLRPMPLGELLDDVVRDYRDRIDALRLDGDLDAEVVADPDHLRRVLINLLDNAVKYGAEPVRIEVRSDTNTVRVAVRDAGEGVPAEFRPRLFEKFAQASSGSTRKASGTGLGLSIVRGLVDAMEGDVWYEPPMPDRHGGFVVQLPRP